MTYEIMGKKLEDYALSLVDLDYPDCDMDAPDFLVAASLIKEGKITEAVKFANTLDTDPKEYILFDILEDDILSEIAIEDDILERCGTLL